MLQTPWYLDYGHLVFWFFFFSTFVIVMWLFYIYTSVAYNIETRRPVRETRGFSRAQVGDTMTAVLPLTWSVTMLAHASVHSTNFDENTTATVFSFSVIAYQWGWNYYFPRDIVDVVSGSPVLLGHKRVTSVYTQDVYASLLAQARQEYYAKVFSANQLSARHGKHVLNQFLQAAFVGPRYTREHSWLISGLAPALDFTQPGIGQRVTFGVNGVGAVSSDQLLLLPKDLRLSGCTANAEFLKLSAYASGQIVGSQSSETSSVPMSRNVQPRAALFDHSYGKRKGNTNPFRAHNTTVYIGNRLNGIYRHLTSSAPLNEGYTTLSRQSFFIQGLNRALPVNADGSAVCRQVDASQGSHFEVATRVGSENIGVNLALTRVRPVTQPWLGALAETGFDVLGSSVSQPSLGGAEVMQPAAVYSQSSLPGLSFRDLIGHVPSTSVGAKGGSLLWSQAEDVLSAVTGSRGNFNTVRFAQKYYFSGLDLTLSGGESQKLQMSDVSGLATNATTELGNLNKALLRSSGVARFVNAFSQVSLPNLSAEDLSRLGFLANPGSGFFSLDLLVKPEVSGSAQAIENRVSSNVHALSGLHAENHTLLFSLLRKDLSGNSPIGFNGSSSSELSSENAATLRSGGSKSGLSLKNTLFDVTSAGIHGSAGLTELAQRLKGLAVVAIWAQRTELFFGLSSNPSSHVKPTHSAFLPKSGSLDLSEAASSESNTTFAYLNFIDKKLVISERTAHLLRFVEGLDLENSFGGVAGLESASHKSLEEPSGLSGEHSFCDFPYLSNVEAEQCVLRTPLVFVNLAWADNEIRGALCKDVTFGRLSVEPKVVFNDMTLALALGLYFPPLAFPLNPAGHLILSELFTSLVQPGHSRLTYNMYTAYAPVHAKVILFLAALLDFANPSVVASNKGSSIVFHQAVIWAFGHSKVRSVIDEYTNPRSYVMAAYTGLEQGGYTRESNRVTSGDNSNTLGYAFLLLSTPMRFEAFPIISRAWSDSYVKTYVQASLWELESVLSKPIAAYTTLLSTRLGLFEPNSLIAAYATVRNQTYMSWHFGVGISNTVPLCYLYEHLYCPMYVYAYFGSEFCSKCIQAWSEFNKILFLWRLGLATLLEEDVVTQTPIAGNAPFAHAAADRLLDTASILTLKDSQKFIAVRRALVALHFSYPSLANAEIKEVSPRLTFDPSQRLLFHVKLDPSSAFTLMGNVGHSQVVGNVTTKNSNVGTALPTFLSFTYFVPTYSALDTHWLEGVSDVYPTRVSDSASADPIFLNSKDLKPLSRQLLGESMLFDWWSRWSWEVLSAGLPWDKLCRSITTKRGLGGILNSTYVLDAAKQIELTELSRQKFDKNSTELLLPVFRKLSLLSVFPELAPIALDAEFGSLVTTPVLTLPTPHLDVDPSFIFFNLTPEINTSRRSDHDARYKVSWGPLAAAIATSENLNDAYGAVWPNRSGPSALTLASSRVIQSLNLMSGIDKYFSASNSAAQSSRLNAQPLPGSVFSNLIQASLGLAMPSLRANDSGAVRDLLSKTERAAFFADISNEADALSVRSERANDLTSPLRLTLTADWANLWEFYTNTSKGLINQSAGLDISSVNLTVLKLMLAYGHQQKISALLAWKQHKLASLEKTSPNFGALLMHEALGQILGAVEASSTTPREGLSLTKRAGYAPIQPGVTNMRRLRVTQGIYLPADLPIHGIFGSKDVIHSWAIPGLGVKVDCIPGYSSHRRLFFRWRGLFWGQCMEVCGRYHHWMPLLVRIVHKDVFLLWCLTYLRLLTSNTLTGAHTFSVENSKQVWDVASAAAASEAGVDVRVALLASALKL